MRSSLTAGQLDYYSNAGLYVLDHEAKLRACMCVCKYVYPVHLASLLVLVNF